jgi:hypothetical protein
VSDLILGAFLAAAFCLCAAGLFSGLWWFRREEAGGEAGAGRVHPNPFEFSSRERWRQTRTYYAALLARDGDGRGERFRRLTKWSLISSGTFVAIFIALIVIDAARR